MVHMETITIQNRKPFAVQVQIATTVCRLVLL